MFERKLLDPGFKIANPTGNGKKTLAFPLKLW